MGGGSGDRKLVWVKWEIVKENIDKYRLGVRSLVMFNKDLLHKWRWNFLKNYNDLWVRFIKELHGDHGRVLERESQCKGSDVWANIVKVVDDVHDHNIVLYSSMSTLVHMGDKA